MYNLQNLQRYFFINGVSAAEVTLEESGEAELAADAGSEAGSGKREEIEPPLSELSPRCSGGATGEARHASSRSMTPSKLGRCSGLACQHSRISCSKPGCVPGGMNGRSPASTS